MAKTIQTNMRLTEEEREFLKTFGGGDIARGVRMLMVKAGFTFAGNIDIHRIRVDNLPKGDFFYYGLIDGKATKAVLIKKKDGFFDLESGVEGNQIEEIRHLAKTLYGMGHIGEEMNIRIFENGHIIWESQIDMNSK